MCLSIPRRDIALNTIQMIITSQSALYDLNLRDMKIMQNLTNRVQFFPVSGQNYQYNVNPVLGGSIFNNAVQRQNEGPQSNVYPILDNLTPNRYAEQKSYQYPSDMQSMMDNVAYSTQQQKKYKFDNIMVNTKTIYEQQQQQQHFLGNLQPNILNLEPLQQQKQVQLCPPISGNKTQDCLQQQTQQYLLSDSVLTDQCYDYKQQNLQWQEPPILDYNASSCCRDQQIYSLGFDQNAVNLQTQQNYLNLNSMLNHTDINCYSQQHQQVRFSSEEFSVSNTTVESQRLQNPEINAAKKLDSSYNLGDCIQLSNGRLKCIPCNKEFSGLTYLKQHRNARHSGLHTYRCDKCGKHFKTELNLSNHVKRHEPETKPHKCTWCLKRYHYKFDLKRHIETKHTVRPLSCDHCSMRFTRNDYLKKHIKGHNETCLEKRKRGRPIGSISKSSKSSSSSPPVTALEKDNSSSITVHCDYAQLLRELDEYLLTNS
uniref:C2H2-type domain-containing protein n=1 Tax=Glossina brevipalpis TaxID=37001 RepID=A0A1A9WF88_9MUSC